MCMRRLVDILSLSRSVLLGLRAACQIQAKTGEWMRILLSDDQAQVRFALHMLLERQPGVEIVGEAVDAEELLVRASATRPDVVLVSWELPGLGEKDSLSALRQGCPDLIVVALSGRPEARRAALEAGADAFVSKTDPPERLMALIEQCHEQCNARSQLRKGVCHD